MSTPPTAGTGLERGHVPTSHEMTLEFGSTGLRRSGDYVQHDFLPQLNGQQGVQVFFEMGENDPLLGGILYAFEMLLRRVKWKIEVPENAPEGEAAQNAAGFVRRMVMIDMDRPFSEVIGDIATMFQYGFAPMEIVYGMADDGRLVIRGLYLRAQSTVSRWDFEEGTGRVRGLFQEDPSVPLMREKYLPRQKFGLFRTTTARDNPQGRSLLRRAYKTYMRNQVLMEAEGRAALRAAGFVLATVPENLLRSDADAAEKQKLAAIKTIVTNVAADRQGAVIFPSSVDPETKQPMYSLQYIVADGQRSADMSPLIERGDARMAGSVLADFMLLGQTGSSSLALGKDKSAFYLTAMQGMVEMVADEFNRHVIAPFWRLSGEDAAIQPLLSGGEIAPVDLVEVSDYMTKLIAAKVLVPDARLESFARELANLPKADESTARDVDTQDDKLTGAVDRINGQRAAAKGPKAKGNEAKRGAREGADLAARAGTREQ